MKSCISSAVTLVAIMVSAFLFAGKTYAHCQIPCGIYGDDTRLTLLAEHITTIEKSMKQINALSSEKELDLNKIVRWVNNKDEHADKISEIVTYYFMAQRVKSVEETDKKAYKAYLKKLAILHKMLVAAMKSKQTTDLKYIKQLRGLLHSFEDL